MGESSGTAGELHGGGSPVNAISTLSRPASTTTCYREDLKTPLNIRGNIFFQQRFPPSGGRLVQLPGAALGGHDDGAHHDGDSLSHHSFATSYLNDGRRGDGMFSSSRDGIRQFYVLSPLYPSRSTVAGSN